jgi:hypothetical protein
VVLTTVFTYEADARPSAKSWFSVAAETVNRKSAEEQVYLLLVADKTIRAVKLPQDGALINSNGRWLCMWVMYKEPHEAQC